VPGLVPSAGVNLIRFYGFGRTDLSLRIAAKTTTKAPRQEGAIYLVGAVNGNNERVGFCYSQLLFYGRSLIGEEFMGLVEAFALFGVMLLLAAMPSTSVMLVVARSATAGVANGLAAVLGIVLGDLVYVALALLGLAAVAELLGSLFMLVRYMGALYLLWLGFRLLRSGKDSRSAPHASATSGGLLASLLTGFFLTLGDVKAILFYASLFPLFIDASRLSGADIGIILAITCLSVGGVKGCYVFAANCIASMSANTRLQGITRKLAGGLMLGAGGYLLFKAS